MKTIQETLRRSESEQNWENWENDDGTWWDIEQVLFCKLDWLLEELGKDSEHYETVKTMQDIIEAMQKK